MDEIEHIKIGPTLKGTSGSWHRKECPFFEFDGRTDPIAMGHCDCTDPRTTQRRGAWRAENFYDARWAASMHEPGFNRRIRDRRKGQDDA